MIYAISDLHLSGGGQKPMSVFGADWDGHEEKIRANWEQAVTGEDFCVVPGDLSWGLKLPDALPDLEFIDRLPGKKILVAGNHDIWWTATSKLNAMFGSMAFIKNSFAAIGDTAVCGSRGWACPGSDPFTAHDEKIYRRELGRIETSLKLAKAQGFGKILLALHFPPTNSKKEPSEILGLVEKYAVKNVVYGHLHGQQRYGQSLLGLHGGCRYELVSADYLGFAPKRIDI
jgi:predicted phosphohydrolase